MRSGSRKVARRMKVAGEGFDVSRFICTLGVVQWVKIVKNNSFGHENSSKYLVIYETPGSYFL